MRIASWNVNSIRARLESTLDWLTAAQPDVVLLQELKCTVGDFPREAIEDLGYNVALHGQKSYNGVAILSKLPLEDVHTTFSCGINDDQCRFIEAIIAGCRYISLYVPNGMAVDNDKYAYKLAFYDAFTSYVRQLLSLNQPLIIGGDFNVAPDLEDAHNPTVFTRTDRILCTIPERQAFHTLLAAGLYDGLKLHVKSLPDQQLPFTWWDYRAGSFIVDKGYRIDHFLLSPQAADLMINAGVDRTPRSVTRPSDHAPIWIHIKH